MIIETKTYHCTPASSGVETWAEAHLLGQFMESRGWEVEMRETMDSLSEELADEAERDWQAGLDYLAQRTTITQAASEFDMKPDSLRHALQRGALFGEKSGATWLTTRAAVVSYLHHDDEPRGLHPNLYSRAL